MQRERERERERSVIPNSATKVRDTPQRTRLHRVPLTTITSTIIATSSLYFSQNEIQHLHVVISILDLLYPLAKRDKLKRVDGSDGDGDVRKSKIEEEKGADTDKNTEDKYRKVDDNYVRRYVLYR